VITLTSGGLSAQRKLTAYGPLYRIDVRVPSTVQSGTPFTMTATAHDAAGNVVTSYEESVGFYVGDPALGYPFVYLAPFKNGVSKNSVSWNTPTQQMQLEVDGLPMPWDGLDAPAGFADSNPFRVLGPFHHLAASFARTDHQTDCDSVQGILTLKATDAAGNVITDYAPDHPPVIIDGNGEGDTAAPFVRGVSKTKLSFANSVGVIFVEGGAQVEDICH
jgi:hypothetical protein